MKNHTLTITCSLFSTCLNPFYGKYHSNSGIINNIEEIELFIDNFNDEENCKSDKKQVENKDKPNFFIKRYSNDKFLKCKTGKTLFKFYKTEFAKKFLSIILIAVMFITVFIPVISFIHESNLDIIGVSAFQGDINTKSNINITNPNIDYSNDTINNISITNNTVLMENQYIIDNAGNESQNIISIFSQFLSTIPPSSVCISTVISVTLK